MEDQRDSQSQSTEMGHVAPPLAQESPDVDSMDDDMDWIYDLLDESDVIADPLFITGQALFAACKRGDADTLAKILKAHPEAISFKRSDYVLHGGSDSPLHVSCAEGHATCVEILLAAGADPHQVCSHGATALVKAIMGGSVECARLLVAAGCDPRAPRDYLGYSTQLLMFAANSGGFECVKYLIEEGIPSPELDIWQGDHSPFHSSGIWGGWNSDGQRRHADVRTFRMLLQAGFHPDPKNGDGKTPLGLHAGRFGGATTWSKTVVECAMALIEFGADVHASDRLGNTALHQAALRGDDGAVKFFLGLGLDVRALNKSGKSALHLACARKDKSVGQVVEILLEAGADPAELDKKGLSAPELLRKRGRLELAARIERRFLEQAVGDAGSLPSDSARKSTRL